MSTPSAAFSGSIPAYYERFLGPYMFEPYAADLASRIELTDVKNVLETACGTGRVTQHLRKKLPATVKLVATDLNADMIDIAKNLYPAEHIDWQVADAQALSFQDQAFDLLVCQFGLMFMPDKAKALRETYRLLGPGGKVLMNTWNSLEKNPAFFVANQITRKYFPLDPPGFFQVPFSMDNQKELQNLFEEAGFSGVQVSLVKKEGRGISAAGIASGMLEGSPIYAAICARDNNLLPLIKDSIEKELARQFGDAPLVSPLEAWVVQALKK